MKEARIEVLETGNFYFVELVKGKKRIALRSYPKEEAIAVRKFAQDMSDTLDCDWIDRRA